MDGHLSSFWFEVVFKYIFLGIERGFLFSRLSCVLPPCFLPPYFLPPSSVVIGATAFGSSGQTPPSPLEAQQLHMPTQNALRTNNSEGAILSQLGTPGNTPQTVRHILLLTNKVGRDEERRIVVQSILGKVFTTRVLQGGQLRDIQSPINKE